MSKRALRQVMQLDKGHTGKRQSGHPRYGLCSSKKELVKLDCCDNWVCDDEGRRRRHVLICPQQLYPQPSTLYPVRHHYNKECLYMGFWET